MTVYTASALQSQNLAAHNFRMLIGGELLDGDASTAMPVIDPATEKQIATSPVASATQVDAAVASAKEAFPAWSALDISERGRILSVLANRIEERAEEIARLVTLEQGKIYSDSLADVRAAIDFARYFANVRIAPEIVRDDESARIEIHQRPLGVVAAILPWNFPFFQAVYKLAPALIVGNTVVLKPSPTTPLNTLMLGELLVDLVPAGVVNILPDGGEVGPKLTSHPDVAKVSFTGSTAVGKAVIASGAPTLKHVTLELGGNDAAIVMEDAEIESTAAKILGFAFGNSGQVCISIKRIFVHSNIYDRFCTSISDLARNIQIGHGLDSTSEMGPLQNSKQYEEAKRYVALANSDGTVIAGGHIPERDGYFVEPTVVRDIADDSELVTQETFGPVRSILSYDDVDDAVRRANSSRYGLGGSVWGTDLERASAVANRLHSGTVWVNQHFALSPDVPFGGWKDSGLGSEFGEEGLSALTATQVINISKV